MDTYMYDTTNAIEKILSEGNYSVEELSLCISDIYKTAEEAHKKYEKGWFFKDRQVDEHYDRIQKLYSVFNKLTNDLNNMNNEDIKNRIEKVSRSIKRYYDIFDEEVTSIFGARDCMKFIIGLTAASAIGVGLLKLSEYLGCCR